MVGSVTNPGRSGVYDWLLQRVTAVVIGVYFVGMVAFLVMNPGMDHASWKACMASLPMQIINTLVLVSVLLHAWAGLWIVTTDYLTRAQIGSAGTAVRLLVQVLVVGLCAVYLLWGLVMIWGGA